jgi:hypothetical protein
MDGSPRARFTVEIPSLGSALQPKSPNRLPFKFLTAGHGGSAEDGLVSQDTTVADKELEARATVGKLALLP